MPKPKINPPAVTQPHSPAANLPTVAPAPSRSKVPAPPRDVTPAPSRSPKASPRERGGKDQVGNNSQLQQQKEHPGGKLTIPAPSSAKPFVPPSSAAHIPGETQPPSPSQISPHKNDDSAVAQTLAAEATGIDAPPLTHARRPNGDLVVIAHDGRKFVFTESYVLTRFPR